MPREKKAAVQQQQQQQQQQRDDPHEIIHLNVGGTKYATSRSTLVSQPGTFLAEMFSGQMGEPRKDMDGSYFIDRDGSSFRHVLNFLRDGTLPSNALSSSESARMRKEMKMEAAFYQIPQLLRWAQGNDTIGGQGTSEADRVVDAYRGACSRVVSAAYGRTAEQLIEEVSDFLIVYQGRAGSVADRHGHAGQRTQQTSYATAAAPARARSAHSCGNGGGKTRGAGLSMPAARRRTAAGGYTAHAADST
jgi:hypothetical protein